MSLNSNGFYDAYIKKLQKKAEEAVKDAQKKAFAEYFETVDKKIREIYKSTIDDFYNYDRSFYNPRGSLYHLINTKSSDDYLSIWFDPSKISYRNGYSGEDGLYDQIFRKGWHGGANINGNMLIPYTNPPIAYNGDKKPWDKPEPWMTNENIKHGWISAERASISPLNDFKPIKGFSASARSNITSAAVWPCAA